MKIELEKKIFQKIKAFKMLIRFSGTELDNLICRRLKLNTNTINILYGDLGIEIRLIEESNISISKAQLKLINRIWKEYVNDFENFGIKENFYKYPRTKNAFDFLRGVNAINK